MRFLAVATVLFALPLAAETRQHGNIIFDIPEGFSYGVRGPTGTLSLEAGPDSPDCPGCTILIGAGATADGSVQAFLTANARRLINPQLAPPPAVSPVQPAEGFDLQGRYPAALQRQWVDSTFQMLFAIQVGDRIEMIAFEVPYQDEAQMGRAMAVYDGDMIPFLEGLRFVSEGAQPLMPPPKPGALSAVWWRSQYWFTTGWNYYLGTATVTDHYANHFLTFWPDGHFFDGSPPGGYGPLDPARLLAEGNMSFGTYRRDGDQVTLSYATGEVEELRLAGNQLMDPNQVTYDLAGLYADGVAIEGRIARIAHVAHDAVSGVPGGVIMLTDITFRTDGTWSATEGTGATVAGRYAVQNGIVLIRHPSGASFSAGYLVYAPDATIWIGSEKLN